jgi:hypothetical protein
MRCPGFSLLLGLRLVAGCFSQTEHSEPVLPAASEVAELNWSRYVWRNVGEFWNTCTRPFDRNGCALSRSASNSHEHQSVLILIHQSYVPKESLRLAVRGPSQVPRRPAAQRCHPLLLQASTRRRPSGWSTARSWAQFWPRLDPR